MIKVYGSENCFKCKQKVAQLKAEGKDFEYINIATLSKEELEKIIETVQSNTLPIVIE